MDRYTPEEQGLAGSLLIYMAGLVAVAAVILVPAYLMNMPERHENFGLAAYNPPPGARLLPVAKPRLMATAKSRTTVDSAQENGPLLARTNGHSVSPYTYNR